jgi:hypothetical protein
MKNLLERPPTLAISTSVRAAQPAWRMISRRSRRRVLATHCVHSFTDRLRARATLRTSIVAAARTSGIRCMSLR